MIIPSSSGSNVKSISKSGSGKLKGDVLLAQGTNITLAQSGQTITVTASGGAANPLEMQVFS